MLESDEGVAAEWVADCYHRTYAGAPADGSAWTQDCQATGDGRDVLRGTRGVERNITPPDLTRTGLLPPLQALGRNQGDPNFRDVSRGFRVLRDM